MGIIILERGERNASLATLFAVARSLGISLGEMFSNIPAATKVGRERRARKR